MCTCFVLYIILQCMMIWKCKQCGFVWLPDVIKDMLDFFPDPEVATNIENNHNLLRWGGRSLTKTRWWQKEVRVEDWGHSTLTNVNFQCFLDPVSHPVRHPFSQSVVYLNQAVSQSTGVLSVPVGLTQSSPAVTALNHRNVPLLSHGLPLYSFSQFT